MTDPAKIALLAEARSAYHNLITGTLARVVVDQNGERVEYASTDQTKLYNYIQQLQAACGGGSSSVSNGPAGFIF